MAVARLFDRVMLASTQGFGGRTYCHTHQPHHLPAQNRSPSSPDFLVGQDRILTSLVGLEGNDVIHCSLTGTPLLPTTALEMPLSRQIVSAASRSWMAFPASTASPAPIVSNPQTCLGVIGRWPTKHPGAARLGPLPEAKTQKGREGRVAFLFSVST